MKNTTLFRITIAACLILSMHPPVFAFEPTYNEILIQKKKLESFCKMSDNQRKYDICEKFKALKGKLPDQISELDTFRKIYEQQGE